MHRILAIGMFAMSSIGQVPRDVVKLPSPLTTGGMSLNDALALAQICPGLRVYAVDVA